MYKGEHRLKTKLSALANRSNVFNFTLTNTCIVLQADNFCPLKMYYKQLKQIMKENSFCSSTDLSTTSAN